MSLLCFTCIFIIYTFLFFSGNYFSLFSLSTLLSSCFSPSATNFRLPCFINYYLLLSLLFSLCIISFAVYLLLCVSIRFTLFPHIFLTFTACFFLHHSFFFFFLNYLLMSFFLPHYRRHIRLP